VGENDTVMSKISIWRLLGLLVVAAVPANGQDSGSEAAPAAKQTQDPTEAKREVEGFWQVDAILDQAVKNIAARYNLNDIQTAETAEMMNTRVKRFLDEHQDEVWPLIRDLAKFQRKGGAPDPQEARRLGPVATKILNEAREEIFRSNEEWREILSPQQRQVHDYDMREMTKSFESMERNFGEWERGQTAPESIFPQPQRLPDEPPTPPKPEDGDIPPATPSEQGSKFVSHLEAYLAKFISDYELTTTQVEAGTSILREIMDRTSAFQAAHDKELDEIKVNLTKAKTREERRALVLERRRITGPLDDLFAEFKARLDQIPDQAQRERFDSRLRGGERTQQRSAIDGSRGSRPPRTVDRGGNKPQTNPDKSE